MMTTKNFNALKSYSEPMFLVYQIERSESVKIKETYRSRNLQKELQLNFI